MSRSLVWIDRTGTPKNCNRAFCRWIFPWGQFSRHLLSWDILKNSTRSFSGKLRVSSVGSTTIRSNRISTALSAIWTQTTLTHQIQWNDRETSWHSEYQRAIHPLGDETSPKRCQSLRESYLWPSLPAASWGRRLWLWPGLWIKRGRILLFFTRGGEYFSYETIELPEKWRNQRWPRRA